jgi:aryl-alcohol dehydrogenase-like predicted oxidoreductase
MSGLKVPVRRWGKTELSIPVIPFGTQGFGNNFGPVTHGEAANLIRHAVDIGVNHFDCARCYGDSLAKLGMAIKNGVVDREEMIISGRVCCHSGEKWGGYGQGTPDYSAQRVLADIEDQLNILGIGHFDALFVHDPPQIEPTLGSGGTLEGLEKARDRGWVNFIGYGMRPHDFHLTVIESGRTDALLCFGDHNLLRQTAGQDILPAAAEKDLGVLNGWSIMRGWLTGAPVDTFVPKDRWQDDHTRAETMRLWCEGQGINMLDLTVQFALGESRIHGNPIGSLNVEQLEANVRAACAEISAEVFSKFFSANL